MYGDALVNLGVALGTSLVFSIVSVKTWKCVWRIHFATADEHGSCNSDDLQHVQDGIRAANWTVASWARWYLAARFTLSLASWAHLILNPSYARALGFDVVGEAVLRLAHTATATCFAAFVATTVCALPAAATSHDDDKGGPPSSMSHHHEETKILFGLGALLGAVGCWLRASVVFSSVFFSYMLIGISEVALNPLLDAAFIGAVAINIIQTTSTSSSSCSHSSPTPLVLELDADGYSRISSTDEIISSNSQQDYALVPTDDGLHPSQQTGENCWLIIAKMFCMAHLFDSMAPMALWIISSLFDAPATSVFMATGVAIAWALLFWVRLDDHQQNNEFLLSKNAQNLHSTINNCCCNNEDDFSDKDCEGDNKWWESFGLSSACFHAAFTTIVYASQWTFVSRTTMTASVDDVEPFLPIYSACKLFSSCCFTYCFFSKTDDGCCSINFSSLTRVVSGTTIFLSILFLLMGFVNVVFGLPLIAMQRFKFYAFCVTWLADGLLRPIFAILRISPLMKRYSKGKSENMGIQAFLTESSRIQAYTFPLIFCGSLWAHGEGRSMSDVTSPAGTGVMVFCSSMAIVSAIGACLMNRMEIGVTI